MNTYIIPSVDSAVGNGNTSFPRFDGMLNEIPSCAFIRPAYLSSRFDTFNPGGSGAMFSWAFTAIGFRKDDLSFLDNKRIRSIRLRLYVIDASPLNHTVTMYCPAGAAFISGATNGACAYNAASGADALPMSDNPDSLVGWRSFTITSLAVLKGVVQRGVRVDDQGTLASPNLATYFLAYPHSHAANAPYIEVQYEDEYTPPVCAALEPSATVVDSDLPVTFRWSYAQSVNAPQTHVSIQVRKTGGSWQNILTKFATSAQSYTAPSGITLRGECQWHVQVFCTAGGVASEWSEVKSFLSTGSPGAPVITNVSPTPLCIVTWQQDAQTGFELYLDGPDGQLWHSGQRLSAEHSLTLPMLLADGGYTLRLRTLNAQGRWGPFASASVLVKNTAVGGIAAACAPEGGSLRLAWTPDGAFDAYAILRDGAEIARVDGAATTYLDREALGLARYVVRGILGRCYTDSNVAAGTCAVAHAVIGDAAEGEFIPLEVRYDAPPRHRQSRAARVRYVQYEGAALPAAYRYGGQSRAHTLQFTLAQRAHYDALLALVGRDVIYKDREGDVFTGVLDGVAADSGGGFDVTLTLTETAQGGAA